MICNSNCNYFEDGARPYCSKSGLAVSEGMICIEGKSRRKPELYIPSIEKEAIPNSFKITKPKKKK